MRINERIAPGSVVTMKRHLEDTEDDRRKGNIEFARYTVIRQYPHFLLVRRSGYLETILNVSMIMDGKATQYNRPEAAGDTPDQIKYKVDIGRTRSKNGERKR